MTMLTKWRVSREAGPLMHPTAKLVPILRQSVNI